MRILIVAAAALVACGPQPETPEQMATRMAEESAAARPAIEAVLGRWGRYMSSGAADSLQLLFTDDVRLQPPNTTAVDGRDGAQSFYGMMTGVGTFDVATTVGSVQAYGPLAYVTGTYTVSFTPGANLPDARATSDTGKYLAVLRRSGGEWLIAAQTWNTDLQIRTPMTAGQ